MRSIFLLFVFLFFQHSLSSATVTWTGGASGIYEIGANWSTGLRPGRTDDVVITGGATAASLVTVSIVGGNEVGSITTTGHVHINLLPGSYGFTVSSPSLRTNFGADTRVSVNPGLSFQIAGSGAGGGVDLYGLMNIAPGARLVLARGADALVIHGANGRLFNSGEVFYFSAAAELENRGGAFTSNASSSIIRGSGVVELASVAGSTYALGGELIPGASGLRFSADGLPAGLPLAFAANTVVRLTLTSPAWGSNVRVLGRGAIFADGAQITLTDNAGSLPASVDYTLIDTEGPLTPPAYTLPTTTAPGRSWLDVSTPQDVIVQNSAVFPVDFAHFSGRGLGKVNQLSWSTASETDNAGFTVQRSANGTDWANLAFVTGAGEASGYEWTDLSPLATNYYRLEQRDFDGALSFSSIVRIDRASDDPFTVFPNPAVSVLNFSAPLSAPAQLLDASGRVMRQLAPGVTRVDVAGLQRGVYLLRRAGLGSLRFLVR